MEQAGKGVGTRKKGVEARKEGGREPGDKAVGNRLGVRREGDGKHKRKGGNQEGRGWEPGRGWELGGKGMGTRKEEGGIQEGKDGKRR